MIKKNGLRYSLGIVVRITLLASILLVGENVRAEIDLFQMPGTLESYGTHFELNNSEYLNITLDSSVPINLILESIPKIVTLQFESNDVLDAYTEIALSGFDPLTTYHKYEDDFHNHTSFTTDAEGNYTYYQDLSTPHIVFIQPKPSTKFIKDDATGGDCVSFGTWNAGTKTCTFTGILLDTIQIDSDYITLEGGGLQGPGGNGVYLPGRVGVTIKHMGIKDFGYGIRLHSSNNNFLIDNTVNSHRGIYLEYSDSNIITGNQGDGVAGWHNPGIYAKGIHNKLSGNHFVEGTAYGIWVVGNENTVNDNSLIGNDMQFNIGVEGDNNLISGNTAFYNPFSIVIKGDYNNIIKNNADRNCNPIGASIKVEGSNNLITDNSAKNFKRGACEGIQIKGSNNIISRNDASSNGIGISLTDSSLNTLNDNLITSNIEEGIKIDSSNQNKIYNNHFNNNINTMIVDSINTWNIPKEAGNNIIDGSNLGGNFWAQPDGNGYSQKCDDSEPDGICDLPYELDSNNIDYLPLALSIISPESIPEFPTIALPLAAIIGMVFLFQRRRKGLLVK